MKILQYIQNNFLKFLLYVVLSWWLYTVLLLVFDQTHDISYIKNALDIALALNVGYFSGKYEGENK